MNFIPVKRCNPYLSRRIGDVVGYIPNQFYLEMLDAIFSGTVESWTDLPSNVQDVILHAENMRRYSLEQESGIKQASLQRIDELKQQLSDIKSDLQREKSDRMMQRIEKIDDLKNTMHKLKNTVEVSRV
jgi:hypothetical protein